MPVRDIMTRDPACCSQSCTAQMAASLMRQWDCGVLPVVDNIFSRHLVGIITDRDLCLAVLPAGRDSSHLFVHEAMTKNPVACRPEDGAGQVLQLMEQNHVRRIPVVDENHAVVGIVSLDDLVRYAAIGERELHRALCKIFEPIGPVGKGRVLARTA